MNSSTENKVTPSPANVAPSTGRGLFRRMAPWLVGLLVLSGGAFWWWKAHVADSAATDSTQASGRPAAPPGGAGRRFAGANAIQPVSVQAVRRQDIRVSVNAIGSISALTLTRMSW
eukprot:gene42995-58214_t